MNQDIIKGKIQSLKGDAKVWIGKKTDNKAIQLDGAKDKFIGGLTEKKGLGQEELHRVLKAKHDLVKKSENAVSQLQHDFKKLTKEEINSVEGNLEALSRKIQKKYNINDEEATQQILQFTEGLYKSKI